MIPSIYQSDEPVEDLKSYCGNYLQEEIQAEGLVRKIENFSRFLETASLVNGELVNMESLSSDTGIPSNSLREYFSILEDTLIGSMLKPLSFWRDRYGNEVDFILPYKEFLSRLWNRAF